MHQNTRFEAQTIKKSEDRGALSLPQRRQPFQIP